MATAPDGIYPFSTRDGKPIPVEIIEPLALLNKSFQFISTENFTLPVGYETCALYSISGCLLEMGSSMPASLVDGTSYSNVLLVPPNTIITAKLIPGTARIRGLSSTGSLWIQRIRKWASLSLQQQSKTI